MLVATLPATTAAVVAAQGMPDTAMPDQPAHQLHSPAGGVGPLQQHLRLQQQDPQRHVRLKGGIFGISQQLLCSSRRCVLSFCCLAVSRG